ncbi:MAG: hypothetical protein KDD73_10755 [Anaerolineales bacterium]|nr:hypothetical protein [Anaerolineales bacterium]MCB9128067.1 hypothetical protein [Ardenticatenales bacterium]
MSQNTTSYDWIYRYSTEVAQMLPAAQRHDIKQEITSLLIDELESEHGEAVSEADVLALLRRYPSPAEMAARYGASQALIGPALYPTYLTVVQLVALIVVIVAIVTSIIGIFTGGAWGVASVLGVIWNILAMVLTSVAIVTLVFAVVERSTSPQQQAEIDAAQRERWRPESLPPVAGTERVSVSGMAGEIITTLVAILWLNYYVTADGSLTIFADGPQLFRLFSPLFLSFIPWLTLLWIGDLVTDIVVLARRRWERPSRLIAIGIGLVSVVLLGVMLSGGPLAATEGMERWVRGGVAAVLLLILIDIGSHLWALYRQRGPSADGALLSTASIR